ncbi:hypothetical protein LSH36_314g00042 [Paralvinella palmiformis]|uniref:Uncharacterized protein n=1 Tax=Paralvinella palmiformis TaxID=53620 RepID=A0AAD9JIB1_9ANNE|nr:hypothetical protein LSH36_314g00042 [Paralvinella palmiformis]
MMDRGDGDVGDEKEEPDTDDEQLDVDLGAYQRMVRAVNDDDETDGRHCRQRVDGDVARGE